MERDDDAPPWEGAPYMSSLQAARRRLALALVVARGGCALVPDLVEEVGRLVCGVPRGLSGVLAAASAERYKAVFVAEMRPERMHRSAVVSDTRWRRIGRGSWRLVKPDNAGCAWSMAVDRPIVRDHRPYGALTKNEQVRRLRALMSHGDSRRHLAHLCCNAGMCEDTFRAVMRVLRVATE